MEPKIESWSDYQSGYRQAVFDLTAEEQEPTNNRTGVLFIGYLLGIFVCALIFKFTGE